MITEDRYPMVVLCNDVVARTLDNGRQARSILLASNEAEMGKYKQIVADIRAKSKEVLSNGHCDERHP
jgi:methyl-accepting chemotaxis protein